MAAEPEETERVVLNRTNLCAMRDIFIDGAESEDGGVMRMVRRQAISDVYVATLPATSLTSTDKTIQALLADGREHDATTHQGATVRIMLLLLLVAWMPSDGDLNAMLGSGRQRASPGRLQSDPRTENHGKQRRVNTSNGGDGGAIPENESDAIMAYLEEVHPRVETRQGRCKEVRLWMFVCGDDINVGAMLKRAINDTKRLFVGGGQRAASPLLADPSAERARLTGNYADLTSNESVYECMQTYVRHAHTNATRARDVAAQRSGEPDGNMPPRAQSQASQQAAEERAAREFDFWSEAADQLGQLVDIVGESMQRDGNSDTPAFTDGGNLSHPNVIFSPFVAFATTNPYASDAQRDIWRYFARPDLTESPEDGHHADAEQDGENHEDASEDMDDADDPEMRALVGNGDDDDDERNGGSSDQWSEMQYRASIRGEHFKGFSHPDRTVRLQPWLGHRRLAILPRPFALRRVGVQNMAPTVDENLTQDELKKVLNLSNIDRLLKPASAGGLTDAERRNQVVQMHRTIVQPIRNSNVSDLEDVYFEMDDEMRTHIEDAGGALDVIKRIYCVRVTLTRYREASEAKQRLRRLFMRDVDIEYMSPEVSQNGGGGGPASSLTDAMDEDGDEDRSDRVCPLVSREDFMEPILPETMESAVSRQKVEALSKTNAYIRERLDSHRLWALFRVGLWRVPSDYRDNVDTAGGGEDSGPINTEDLTWAKYERIFRRNRLQKGLDFLLKGNALPATFRHLRDNFLKMPVARRWPEFNYVATNLSPGANAWITRIESYNKFHRGATSQTFFMLALLVVYNGPHYFFGIRLMVLVPGLKNTGKSHTMNAVMSFADETANTIGHLTKRALATEPPKEGTGEDTAGTGMPRTCSTMIIHELSSDIINGGGPGDNSNEGDHLLKDIFSRSMIDVQAYRGAEDGSRRLQTILSIFMVNAIAALNIRFNLNGPMADRFIIYNQYDVKRDDFNKGDQNSIAMSATEQEQFNLHVSECTAIQFYVNLIEMLITIMAIPDVSTSGGAALLCSILGEYHRLTGESVSDGRMRTKMMHAIRTATVVRAVHETICTALGSNVRYRVDPDTGRKTLNNEVTPEVINEIRKRLYTTDEDVAWVVSMLSFMIEPLDKNKIMRAAIERINGAPNRIGRWRPEEHEGRGESGHVSQPSPLTHKTTSFLYTVPSTSLPHRQTQARGTRPAGIHSGGTGMIGGGVFGGGGAGGMLNNQDAERQQPRRSVIDSGYVCVTRNTVQEIVTYISENTEENEKASYNDVYQVYDVLRKTYCKKHKTRLVPAEGNIHYETYHGHPDPSVPRRGQDHPNRRPDTTDSQDQSSSSWDSENTGRHQPPRGAGRRGGAAPPQPRGLFDNPQAGFASGAAGSDSTDVSRDTLTDDDIYEGGPFYWSIDYDTVVEQKAPVCLVQDDISPSASDGAGKRRPRCLAFLIESLDTSQFDNAIERAIINVLSCQNVVPHPNFEEAGVRPIMLCKPFVYDPANDPLMRNNSVFGRYHSNLSPSASELMRRRTMPQFRRVVHIKNVPDKPMVIYHVHSGTPASDDFLSRRRPQESVGEDFESRFAQSDLGTCIDEPFNLYYLKRHLMDNGIGMDLLDKERMRFTNEGDGGGAGIDDGDLEDMIDEELGDYEPTPRDVFEPDLWDYTPEGATLVLLSHLDHTNPNHYRTHPNWPYEAAARTVVGNVRGSQVRTAANAASGDRSIYEHPELFSSGQEMIRLKAVQIKSRQTPYTYVDVDALELRALNGAPPSSVAKVDRINRELNRSYPNVRRNQNGRIVNTGRRVLGPSRRAAVRTASVRQPYARPEASRRISAISRHTSGAGNATGTMQSLQNERQRQRHTTWRATSFYEREALQHEQRDVPSTDAMSMDTD